MFMRRLVLVLHRILGLKLERWLGSLRELKFAEGLDCPYWDDRCLQVAGRWHVEWSPTPKTLIAGRVNFVHNDALMPF